MDKALRDEPCVPHRLTTSKGCGFVFIPLQRRHLPTRQVALRQLTAANKYDQKLDKCIGLSFIAEGNESWCDVQWFPLEFPWKEDAALREALNHSYPFRPVKSGLIERYGLADAPKFE